MTRKTKTETLPTANLKNRFNSVLEHGRDSLESIRSGAVRRAQQADELVHEHPYYALGIAAGIGALIGIFVSRKISR